MSSAGENSPKVGAKSHTTGTNQGTDYPAAHLANLLYIPLSS
jgi:hypothetical protein